MFKFHTCRLGSSKRVEVSAAETREHSRAATDSSRAALVPRPTPSELPFQCTQLTPTAGTLVITPAGSRQGSSSASEQGWMNRKVQEVSLVCTGGEIGP